MDWDSRTAVRTQDKGGRRRGIFQAGRRGKGIWFYQKILLEVGRLAPSCLIDADGNFIFASDAFLTDMGLEAGPEAQRAPMTWWRRSTTTALPA